jgi:outer membrane receptor for ferrienterochelin and colicin
VLHYRTLAVRGNVTSVRGNHTIRAGGEWRQQNVAGGGPQASNNVGGPSGQFNFDNTYVQENNNTDGAFPQSSTGTSYASFLLGIQTTATVTSVPALSRSNPYYAFYVGDTWRVTRKLTLIPGIRYEFEYGPTEKHNRQIVGWDPNAQLEFAGMVNTAYKSTSAGRAYLCRCEWRFHTAVGQQLAVPATARSGLLGKSPDRTALRHRVFL